MNILGFNFGRKSASLDTVLARLEAAHETSSGITVTPENCEESPTVQAIVNAIAMHFVTLPVHVERKTSSGGRESKERLPNHPVARLLQRPNDFQTGPNFWLDAASVLVRHGRFFAVKGRGVTGPIRRLIPIHPSCVQLKMDANMDITARVTFEGGDQRDYPYADLLHVRLGAKDFLGGDSPVMKAKDAIALEIAAQRFGANFFGNGAMPGLLFKLMQGFKMTKEQRDDFVVSFQQAYSGKSRFRAMVMPAGMEDASPIPVENDKAQFLETRKLQRNIIAGAFGVPPHLVGDLERGTFSNIEHQSQEFQQKVILPIVRLFEGAMERSLLTDEDRRDGVVIRFNLDAGLRADFKTRQEGMKIQREMGVISADDWREREGMNPLPAGQGGDIYWQQGPSGQNGDSTNDDDQSQRPL